MNLKNLFKPKLLEARTLEPSKREEGLVYAVNYDANSSSIYLYADGEKDIHLCDRWHTVTSLCVHNNWLYDGGYKTEGYPFLNELNTSLGFVIDTITGKDMIGRENNLVYSLGSHNGKLYRGGHNGVFEVSTGERIARREGKVTALCSHEGTLYDGGHYKGMYNTFKNEARNKKKYVPYLCSWKNILHGIDSKFDKDFYFSGYIFDVLKNKKIKNIEETPTSICSYKDELYYSYSDVIIGLNNEWLRHDKKGIRISAICSIPKELAEQIKHTKNYGFSFNEIQRINPKGFIEYLTNVSDSQERRRIIEQLFNYDQVHEDVIDWLNKNEKDIMRKAAFY